MAFSLNDIISRSEKKSREKPTIREEIKPVSGQKIGLNVVTVEEQQRRAEETTQLVTKEKILDAASQRTYQVKTRLTEDEKRFFDQRVRSSGMNQGDFMRQILLHESVVIQSVTAADSEALETLSGIASELGRIGGMIRGTVIRNKGEFGVLSPQEKSDLECQIRELNRLKADIQKAVLTIYGDH